MLVKENSTYVNSLEQIKVYVDASYKDGKAGIGIYIDDLNDTTFQIYLDECEGSTQAELIAILKGIEIVKRLGRSLCEIKVMTDSLGLVIKYGGYISGVKTEWIPRRYNLAHYSSVKARCRKVY